MARVILGKSSSNEVHNPMTSPAAAGIEMTDAKAPAAVDDKHRLFVQWCDKHHGTPPRP